jgi:Domain of unknown function (DUF4328)
MSQHPQEPPEHPAAAYYPAPAYAPAPPKDLTAFGVLAFSTAALTTVFNVVNATVVGRAIRHVGTADQGELDWSVAVYAIGSVLAGLALLGGWITGSMWLFRARKNAELLGPGALFVRSSGWAWGGWICPIVSLWFPFQVVRDTHRAVASYFQPALVGWWWGMFLFMTVGGRIAGQAGRDATAADASGVQGAEIFFALVMVAALVLWGLVLRKITREQHARMYGGRTAV